MSYDEDYDEHYQTGRHTSYTRYINNESFLNTNFVYKLQILISYPNVFSKCFYILSNVRFFQGESHHFFEA